MLIESPVTVVIGDVKTKDEIKIPKSDAVMSKIRFNALLNSFFSISIYKSFLFPYFEFFKINSNPSLINFMSNIKNEYGS